MGSDRRYEAGGYWSALLTEHFDLRGVGYPDLPASFNAALFAAMREAVLQELAAERIQVSAASVLDIGCGTGFWVELWRELGAPDVVGLDLAEVSAERLRGRYPEYVFHRGDISGEELPFAGRRFDLVSAMSVLLHVTDPVRFERSLANLAAVLAPGGTIIAIEPLIAYRWRGPHFDERSNSRARSRAEWEAALARHGLALVRVRPVTCLLAETVDTRSAATFRLGNLYWRALSKLEGRETLGRVAIALLMPLDRLCLRMTRTGPSTKCLVIRHKQAD